MKHFRKKLLIIVTSVFFLGLISNISLDFSNRELKVSIQEVKAQLPPTPPSYSQTLGVVYGCGDGTFGISCDIVCTWCDCTNQCCEDGGIQ